MAINPAPVTKVAPLNLAIDSPSPKTQKVKQKSAGSQQSNTGIIHTLEAPISLVFLSAFLGIIVGFIVGKKWIDKIWDKAVKYLKPSAETSNKDRDIQESGKYFIPNRIEILNEDGSATDPMVGSGCTDSVDFFIKKIFRNDQRMYFILAPTGVGKTTFMDNLYAAYAKNTRMSCDPQLFYAAMGESDKRIDELIQSGESKNMILMLDALDEMQLSKVDIGKSSQDKSSELSKAMMAKWDEQRERFRHFKKVVVTARDQFFNDENLDFGIHDGRKPEFMQKIRLLPFTDPGIREDYIRKRYAEKSDQSQIEMMEYARHMAEQGKDFINIPLILDHLYEIWYKQKANKAHNNTTSDIDLFKALEYIVSEWVARELEKTIAGGLELKKTMEERKKNEMARDNLTNFCMELSRIIAVPGTADDMVNITKLKALENKYEIASTFRQFSDRSLLIRENEKGQTNYRFVHRAFLEYFLTKDFELMETPDVGLESEFNFAAFPFMYQFLTDRNIKRLREQSQFKDWSMSIEAMREWLPFIALNGINTHKAKLAKQLDLQQRLRKEVFDVLNPVLTITNTNFWNSKAYAPYEEASIVIPFFRDFIFGLILHGIDVTDEQLICFDGVTNLRILYLRECKILTGDGLRYFSQAAPTLKKLHINCQHPQFTGDFSMFQTANNISQLALLLPKFNIDTLQYFKNTVKSLSHIEITGVGISDKSLSVFSGCNKLKILRIESHYFDGSGLHHFAECVPCLRSLVLYGNNIEDKSLAVFKDAGDLVDLQLSGNKLTGNCLIYFRSRVNELVRLIIGGDQFKDDDFAIFKEAGKIKCLNIIGNRSGEMRGSGLMYFANSVNKLESLHILMPELEENNLKVFLPAENLKHIYLYTDGISNEGMKNFAKAISNIEYLGLVIKNFSPELLKPFCGAKKLRAVDIDLCPNISDSEKDAFFSTLPSYTRDNEVYFQPWLLNQV